MTKILGNVAKFAKFSHRAVTFSYVRHLSVKKPPWKVMFFGSDEFSLYSLKALSNEYTNSPSSVLKSLEVVTGSHINPVWKFSNANNLKVHKWPPSIDKNEYDLGLVVSFGHLIPEVIIDKFPLGMLNVHASLLPRWRGASPIVYAIARGDPITGVTIMKIKPQKFDIGEILNQKTVDISPTTTMPELYAKLGETGAKCLINTIFGLEDCLKNCKKQPDKGATYAPKIGPDFSQIHWNFMSATDIFNLQRALKSIFPLKTTWNNVAVKLHDVEVFEGDKPQSLKPGLVIYSKTHKVLLVQCAHGTWISVPKVGVEGKKTMKAVDFYNGFVTKVNYACFTYFVVLLTYA